MNGKVTIVLGLSATLMFGGFLALSGAGVASVANADGDTPAVAAAPPVMQVPSGVVLDPIKVAWENKVAADLAQNAAVAADPAMLASVLAQKAAYRAQMDEVYSKPQPPQDIHDQGAVGLPVGAPPMSSLEFLSTSGEVQVIHDECVAVYVGYLGLDHPTDGGVFVTYRTAAGDIDWNKWSYPGQGPLTLTKLTSGGIATIVPATGEPFTLDISKH